MFGGIIPMFSIIILPSKKKLFKKKVNIYQKYVGYVILAFLMMRIGISGKRHMVFLAVFLRKCSFTTDPYLVALCFRGN